MTISITASACTYTGNGSQQVFDVKDGANGIYFEAAAELSVTLRSDDTITAQTLGTHYTVAGAGTDTGTVTFLAAPGSGVEVRIERNTAKTQTLSLAAAGAFDPAALMGALDKNVRMIQDVARGSGGGGGGGTYNDTPLTLDPSGDEWDADDKVIKGLADPVTDDEAVNKGYADAHYGTVAILDINGLDALVDFNPATDKLVVYDASAGAHKSLIDDVLARYGVDVTGATDATVAVQAILDAGIDYVPIRAGALIEIGGTVEITSPVMFDGLGSTSPGGTSAKAAFVAGSTTNDMFHVASNSVVFDGIEFRGIGGRATSVNLAANQSRAVVVGPDSRTVTGSITAADQTVTITVGTFTSSDIGARIHIPGAYNGTSTPTISSLNSSTSVEVSIAADNTVAGVSIDVAQVYRDFSMSNCSASSHSIGLDLRNASNARVTNNGLHGFYAMRLACEIASDIGDSYFSGNEYNTAGGAGSVAVYHNSSGSPRFVSDKFQTAETQYLCDWTKGTSGGPQFIGCIWENASARHMLFQDDSSGTKILENVIIAGNIFNGAPTVQIDVSDSTGTGWLRGLEIVGNRFTSSGAGTMLLLGRAVDGAHVATNTFNDPDASGATAINIKVDSDEVFVGVNRFDGVASTVTNASATSRFDAHALVQLASTGVAVRSSTNAWVTRTITGTTNEITATNGDGVAGNPTLSLPSTLELAAKTVNVGDANFAVKDTADATKIAKFECASITTATTRTFTLPDINGTLLALVSGNANPLTSGGGALGTTALMWSGVFIATGGTLNFNNGAAVIMHSGNKLTVTGGNNEVFEIDGGTAGTVGRVKSSGSAAYLGFQNTGGTPASALLGISGGGDLELQAAAAKGLQVKKAGGTYAYAKAGPITASADVAIPAGGTAGEGIMVSTTTNFGMFFGSGAPSLAAAKGSLYMRSDGSGTTNRMYVNTDGSTTWTAVTTVA